MVQAAALNALDSSTIERMGERELTEEEREELKAELAEDYKKQMEDQKNMGLFMVSLALVIMLIAWANGYVSWHFNSLARLLGFKRFIYPQDVSWFTHLVIDTVKSKFSSLLSASSSAEL